MYAILKNWDFWIKYLCYSFANEIRSLLKLSHFVTLLISLCICVLPFHLCVCVCVCARAHVCACYSVVSDCDPMDCSPPGSSIHGILQAKILEWVAISYSRESSRWRDWTWISHREGRLFSVWATREALHFCAWA